MQIQNDYFSLLMFPCYYFSFLVLISVSDMAIY